MNSKIIDINNDNGFDMSEWIVPQRNYEGKKSSVIMQYSIKKVDDKKSLLTISFGQEVSDHIGAIRKDKVHFAFHRDDNSRLLLFKSDNGFSLAQPSKKTLYFFIKTKLKNDLLKGLTTGKYNIDPIYRKNRVVEIRLN